MQVTKTLDGTSPVYETDTVSFTLDVVNNSSDNSVPNSVETAWAQAINGYVAGFSLEQNVIGASGPDGIYGESNLAGDDVENIGGFSFPTSTETITKVEVVLVNHLINTLIDDNITLEVFYNSISQGIQNFTASDLNQFGPTSANEGELIWDITALRAWDWGDFESAIEVNFTSAAPNGLDDVVNPS